MIPYPTDPASVPAAAHHLDHSLKISSEKFLYGTHRRTHIDIASLREQNQIRDCVNIHSATDSILPIIIVAHIHNASDHDAMQDFGSKSVEYNDLTGSKAGYKLTRKIRLARGRVFLLSERFNDRCR